MSCSGCSDVPDQEEVQLSVAHGNDGDVEIIPPSQITNTHVIIDIQGHCVFGLLRARPFQARLITAQVLLFYKTLRSTLHMHLVPGNVPFEEVTCFNEYAFVYYIIIYRA